MQFCAAYFPIESRMSQKIDITVIEKVENPDEALVPQGPYCYAHTGNTRLVSHYFDGNGNKQEATTPYEMPELVYCPYFRIHPEKDEQENGYCALMGIGDWESEHMSLLWDSVKECGINDEDE